MPILVGLGFWQLQRADYKQGLQDLYEQRSAAASVALSELAPDQDVTYVQVQLQGRFDNEHHFLLDNRVLNGRPGYEVISAFQLNPAVKMASGKVFELIWVNRGWVPLIGSRNTLPEIASLFEQTLTLSGQLVKPSKAFVLADVPLSGVWPEVIQSIELPQMNERLLLTQRGQQSAQVAPYLLRAAANEPGSFQVNWQPVNTSPEKSLGYAVQWFLMALVLTGLYFWAAIKQK